MAELTSITEHSDWLDNQSITVEEKWNCHRKRVEFGKQPLEIWMFVPCKLVNGVWVVLEEPDADYYKMVTEQDLKEYEQAKSLCLFEGFEYSDIGYWYINTQENGMLMFDEENIENQTIEDLVKHKLTLTPASEKQIGL